MSKKSEPAELPPVIHGLGIFTGAMFLAGEMAGSGVLALPHAISDTGIAGLAMIILFSLNGGYIGFIMGRTWETLAESHSEFNERTVRDAYPLMAEKSGLTIGPKFAKVLRVLTIISVVWTLFGASIVFMELMAGIMEDLTREALPSCVWIVIVAAVLVPLTWLGTPKDFWQMAAMALVTTTTVCIICCVRYPMEVTSMEVPNLSNISKCTGGQLKEGPPHKTLTAEGFFTAFGSIMFAFGGASIFPSIQADMSDRSKFKYAAVLALSMLFIIYFPTATVSYFTLGDCVQESMLNSLTEGTLKDVAQALILIHLIAATPICLNPPNQWLESLFNIPTDFTWKRCVFRTSTLILLLFIALSIPNFGAILSLVGGSTVTLMTFVFPPLFNILATKASSSRDLNIIEAVYCCFLILLGIGGGVSSTYAALRDIIETHFVTPCYIQWFK